MLDEIGANARQQKYNAEIMNNRLNGLGVSKTDVECAKAGSEALEETTDLRNTGAAYGEPGEVAAGLASYAYAAAACIGAWFPF